jgi:hypothetical protein
MAIRRWFLRCSDPFARQRSAKAFRAFLYNLGRLLTNREAFPLLKQGIVLLDSLRKFPVRQD